MPAAESLSPPRTRGNEFQEIPHLFCLPKREKGPKTGRLIIWRRSRTLVLIHAGRYRGDDMQLWSVLPCAVALFGISMTAAQSVSTSPIPHLEKRGKATQLIVDGRPFLILAGELTN